MTNSQSYFLHCHCSAVNIWYWPTASSHDFIILLGDFYCLQCKVCSLKPQVPEMTFENKSLCLSGRDVEQSVNTCALNAENPKTTWTQSVAKARDETFLLTKCFLCLWHKSSPPLVLLSTYSSSFCAILPSHSPLTLNSSLNFVPLSSTVPGFSFGNYLPPSGSRSLHSCLFVSALFPLLISASPGPASWVCSILYLLVWSQNCTVGTGRFACVSADKSLHVQSSPHFCLCPDS